MSFAGDLDFMARLPAMDLDVLARLNWILTTDNFSPISKLLVFWASLCRRKTSARLYRQIIVWVPGSVLTSTSQQGHSRSFSCSYLLSPAPAHGITGGCLFQPRRLYPVLPVGNPPAYSHWFAAYSRLSHYPIIAICDIHPRTGRTHLRLFSPSTPYTADFYAWAPHLLLFLGHWQFWHGATRCYYRHL